MSFGLKSYNLFRKLVVIFGNYVLVIVNFSTPVVGVKFVIFGFFVM